MSNRNELRHTDNGNYHKGFYNDGNYEEILSEIEYTDIFLQKTDEEDGIDDANCLWQGACDCFALELYKAFNYDIYRIKGEKSHHTFCRAVEGGKEYYVDVRGMTSDIEEFKKGLDFFINQNSQITHIGHQQLENEINECMEKEDWANKALEFAQHMILQYACCYAL